jgi:cellulose biosynthesis protein BcsQ
LHREIIENLVKSHPEILNTAIPYASDIERMGLERMPLGGFVHKSPSTKAYNELWQEMMRRADE